MDLFSREQQKEAPLAHRFRPRVLSEVVGQPQLTAPDAPFLRLVRSGRLPSMLLAGPPGCGKTSLSYAIEGETGYAVERVNATFASVADLRKIIAVAIERRTLGKQSVVFVDEIHRFNKAQQDVLLPYTEDGTVTLIGATTENPSFSVNAALLSRMRVFRLNVVPKAAVVLVLERALHDAEHGLGRLQKSAQRDVLEMLAEVSRGDVRKALSLLESAAQQPGAEISLTDVTSVLGEDVLAHDKAGDAHFDLASALIKSMRGTDPDAAIYYLMRLLAGGEDPKFITRRLIIFASEDIGNADPVALQTAIAADQALQRVGLPEAKHALAQCVTYLASTVKSNAAYDAFVRAEHDVERYGALEVPLHLRNAVSAEMRRAGYGEGYRYPHDEGGYAAGATYLPPTLQGKRYYEPKDTGFEARIKARLERLRAELDKEPT